MCFRQPRHTYATYVHMYRHCTNMAIGSLLADKQLKRVCHNITSRLWQPIKLCYTQYSWCTLPTSSVVVESDSLSARDSSCSMASEFSCCCRKYSCNIWRTCSTYRRKATYICTTHRHWLSNCSLAPHQNPATGGHICILHLTQQVKPDCIGSTNCPTPPTPPHLTAPPPNPQRLIKKCSAKVGSYVYLKAAICNV